MKNTITDLTNYLFEQMERINDDSLTPEQLERELDKADAMVKVSGQIIQAGELAFKTMKHMDEYGYGINKDRHVPAMLDMKGNS